ncbi:serine hydrolase [Robiginitalea sp. IMCC43444]|uniref:serine hydrolase n=1 Tax=Robiginitalea sp. IMCC43444 TaxID=3459121 RepID=UPI004043246D
MKIKLFGFVLLWVLNGWAQAGLPLNTSDSEIRPLRELVDNSLQAKLARELRSNPKWEKLIAEKRMAVGVVDLSNPNAVRFARLNGDHMMYAASLPKIAILLAAMDALEKGELRETPEIKTDMRRMISKSDNQASTRLIDLLGYDKIESVMTDPRYSFYDAQKGGGLWVGKRYGKGGGTNREPLKNLSHAASVNQVCRYYYLLANGKLVNEKRSRQMLDIFENPELHHKFVKTLDVLAPGARLFRKSGTWKTYHSDSILVWGKDPARRYILVALIDDPSGEQIIRDLVRPVEKILKKS